MLEALVGRVPYIGFLGIRFENRGDELTAILPFQDMLIGNPALPALHGGVTAAFLEVSAIVGLSWETIWTAGKPPATDPDEIWMPRMPRTIDFTVDYLRSGQPRDAYARAHVTRSGRRYASVLVEAWQETRARPFAQAMGHFVMPRQ